MSNILKVTEGSPLYIEDLLRLAHVVSVGDAIRRWEDRAGDQARAFALQRELEDLTRANPLGRLVLIVCAVANGAVSSLELGRVLNREVRDIEDALDHLRRFYLIPSPTHVEDVVLFDLNYNTRNLVLQEFGATEEAARVRGAFKSLGRIEETRNEEAEIGAICSQARLLTKSGRYEDADSLLKDLDSKYPNRGVVFQQIGWLYKRWEPSPRVAEAREAFQRAEDLGVRRADLYWHWSELEETQGRFREAAEVAARGTDRTGTTQSLSLREANACLQFALERGRNGDRYTAQDEWTKTLAIARRGVALDRRHWESEDLRSRLFVIAFRAARTLRQRDVVEEVLGEWETTIPTDPELAQAQSVASADGW